MMQTGHRQDHALAARAYGVLATGLTEALEEARHALTLHAPHLAAGTLGGLDSLRDEFARRRVRIAVYGEVKAGKSTLLNAIAGAALSPVAFDPLTSVPVRITYGPATVWRVGNDHLGSLADLEERMRANDTADDVVVETHLELLQLGGQVDLLDTPGLGSEARFDAVTAEALRSLDAVILVVRYPALFTQFTRHLVGNLHGDITKLFVVWNLDAACVDLAVEERQRHAATLKANVSGSHDLFLVDARAGFRATDAAARAASGINALTNGLTSFLSSSAREISALREAAKRAQQSLIEAHRHLDARRALLAQALLDAHARLDAVQAAADAEAETERSRFASFEATASQLQQQSAATAARHADSLRAQLRAARRRWIRAGDIETMKTTLEEAISRYGDNMAASSRETLTALRSEAATYGAPFSRPEREPTPPLLGRMTSEDRNVRATSGSLQMLRRALWRRWYLPGVTQVEREDIAHDLVSHTAWLDDVVAAACAAGRAVLDQHLAVIAQRAEAELRRIKLETDFEANQRECAQLDHDLPALATQAESVATIEHETRRLVGTD